MSLIIPYFTTSANPAMNSLVGRVFRVFISNRYSSFLVPDLFISKHGKILFSIFAKLQIYKLCVLSQFILRHHSWTESFNTAFKAGGVMGFSLTGIALLSLYALMFELQTGQPIVSTRLVQVHPGLDEVRIVPLFAYQKGSNLGQKAESARTAAGTAAADSPRFVAKARELSEAQIRPTVVTPADGCDILDETVGDQFKNTCDVT